MLCTAYRWWKKRVLLFFQFISVTFDFHFAWENVMKSWESLQKGPQNLYIYKVFQFLNESYDCEQNQQTREFSTWKMSHKHNNKDLSCWQWLSPGITPPEVYPHIYIYIYIIIWGCTSGGVYVPCIITQMPGESYHRQLGSLLLCSCDVFWALINCLVCWLCTGALGCIPGSTPLLC